MTRVKFSQWIAADSGYVSNVEYGRAPVRFWLGRAVCERAQVSPVWLAEGKGPFMVPFSFAASLANEDPNNLFSAVYEQRLRQPAAYVLKVLSILGSSGAYRPGGREGGIGDAISPPGSGVSDVAGVVSPMPIGMTLREASKYSILGLVAHSFEKVPDESIGRFTVWIYEQLAKFNAALPGVTLEPQEKEHPLTSYPERSNSPQVRSSTTMPKTVDELIAKVADLCSRQTQAEVARKAGVGVQRLNDWLKGRRSPGGEAVLRLLKMIAEEKSGPLLAQSGPQKAHKKPNK